MTETVAKSNMCQRDWKALLSKCGAKTVEDQINCSYRYPHTFLKRCMFYREDMSGACDNLWAQHKIEMPKGVVELLNRTTR